MCVCVCVCVCVNMWRDSKAKAPNYEQQLSSEGSRGIGLEEKKSEMCIFTLHTDVSVIVMK